MISSFIFIICIVFFLAIIVYLSFKLFLLEKKVTFLSSNQSSALEVKTNGAQDKQNTAEDFAPMLHDVLNTIPVRVFWKDLEGNYLGGNNLFVKDAGKESELDLIGRNDFDMSWNEQAELYRLDDKHVIQTGDSKINYEEPQTDNKGKNSWLRTSKIPLRNSKGEIYGILGTYEDITHSKQNSLDLENHKQNLERLVIVRTNELDAINEELKALNEDLFLQRELIIAQRNELEIQNKELINSHEKLFTINENQESVIKNRTFEIEQKNQKLLEYAYINSHLLRSPVARIKGLINLMAVADKKEDIGEYLNYLTITTTELDDIVISITNILNNEDQDKVNELQKRVRNLYNKLTP